MQRLMTFAILCAAAFAMTGSEAEAQFYYRGRGPVYFGARPYYHPYSYGYHNYYYTPPYQAYYPPQVYPGYSYPRYGYDRPGVSVQIRRTPFRRNERYRWRY